MKRTSVRDATVLILAVRLSAWSQAMIDFPNHQLHNFYVGERTYEHAVAMGYRLVPWSGKVNRNGHPEYKRLGIIRNHNAHICPLRIHVSKADGKLFVTYHGHAGITPDGLNPVALMNGIRRKVGYKPREMDADDLRMLTAYGAAVGDAARLTMQNVSYGEIQRRFRTSWPLENAGFKSCNVLCNWQSRKVVEDMVKSTLENVPWKKYDALFFDSLTGGLREGTTNAEFGGKGAYPTWLDGKLAFVKAVVDFVRDPSKTGRKRPYLVFTNIYDPVGWTPAKTWYGTGRLRLDHYYFEKGCKEPGGYLKKHGYRLGTQHANGVVPGTTQPAYVYRDKQGKHVNPQAYLPANLVALDDAYTWSMRVSKKPSFDHAAFFDQHLDACGTAGIQGSWFGWYGEDYMTIRDTEKQLIYSNACQLLRAIPNWDNVRGIAVPPFSAYADTDRRRWNGKVYSSTHSFASHDVVYSRNPDNEELYIVFLTPEGVVRLLPGERLNTARFVNPFFTKADEDALPHLAYAADRRTLTLEAADCLGRGIRITTEQATPK